MTEPIPIEAWMQESGALQKGHFQLSSGLHSSAYVQCALLLQDPAKARLIGRQLAEKLVASRPTSVLSPALGGLIIGHEVAGALGVPFRFTERVDGVMVLRRGFALAANERIVIVEDVITTGKSTLETVEVARRLGAEPCAVGSILDRTGGRHEFDAPFHSLLDLDLPTYAPEACPMCALDQPFSKPGSRPIP